MKLRRKNKNDNECLDKYKEKRNEVCLARDTLVEVIWREILKS